MRSIELSPEAVVIWVIMLLATRGLLVRTLDEAEFFLQEFIWCTLRDPSGPMQRHSLDYDLYLPWVHEEVRNAPSPPDYDAHSAVLIDRLLMDASWILVQKGLVRPGPRGVSSEVRAGDYGKGFSLTATGMAWVKEYGKAYEHKLTENELVTSKPSA